MYSIGVEMLVKPFAYHTVFMIKYSVFFLFSVLGNVECAQTT